MDKPNGLERNERIRGRSRIDNIFRDGISGFVYPFRYVYTAAGEEQGEVSMMVSVSKRYHKKANKRNLQKRRTREAYRTSKTAIRNKAVEAGKKVDIALIYSTKNIEDYKTVQHAIGRILAQIGESI